VSDSDEEGEAEDLMEEELEDDVLEGAIEVDVEDEEVLDEEEPPGTCALFPPRLRSGLSTQVLYLRGADERFY
jgi:hypothetical protein